MNTLTGVVRVEQREANFEDVCRHYENSGYSLSETLLEFLRRYREVSVTWAFREVEVLLAVAVDDALGVYAGNIKSYSRRVGKPLVPIGLAFDTEEVVLLAENWDVFLAGDAGIQYVGNGFVESVQSLISGDWDKTFF